MRVYLTMGPDGRILVQARIEEGNSIGDLLQYVAQGDQFNGVDYNTLAQSTPGPFDVNSSKNQRKVSNLIHPSLMQRNKRRLKDSRCSLVIPKYIFYAI